MTKKNLSPELYRVIDANLNRLKEGIRVSEDIFRYAYNNKTIATELKQLRHLAKIDDLDNLLNSRDSQNDVLRKTQEVELNRSDIGSIITANFKRAQESSRVLEEMFKIVDPNLSELFKNIRYNLYTLEKTSRLNNKENLKL